MTCHFILCSLLPLVIAYSVSLVYHGQVIRWEQHTAKADECWSRS